MLLLAGLQHHLSSHPFREGRECSQKWKAGGELVSRRHRNLIFRFCIRSGGKRTRSINLTGSLAGCRVAFTTPVHYAPRLEEALRQEGADVVWCPTIATECTDETRDEVDLRVKQLYDGSGVITGVAFTSRAGMKAFSVALAGRRLPEDPFVVAALGKDAEYLNELQMLQPNKVEVLTPAIATPSALVEALGEGKGRKILCPVPLVEGLEEPSVVPDFLTQLRAKGWTPVRVDSYITRWMGKDCARELLSTDIHALIFTSTAEIEGLFKSLDSLEERAGKWRKRENRMFLVATHGPVTAHGAHRLGIDVDVVGRKFHSFSGIVEQLAARLAFDPISGA